MTDDMEGLERDLRMLREYADEGADHDGRHDEITHAYHRVRRHLTASGVPESVRELPAEWENGTEGMTDSAAAAYRCCARALRFALASAPADGYKLVPVEPTPKMVDATWDHDEDETESHNTRNHRIWSAMIEAAPTDGRD